MTHASMTYGRPARVVIPRPAQWLATVTAALAAFFARQGPASMSIAELLARADSLQDTQPSFAADLRAAALRAQSSDAG